MDNAASSKGLLLVEITSPPAEEAAGLAAEAIIVCRALVQLKSFARKKAYDGWDIGGEIECPKSPMSYEAAVDHCVALGLVKCNKKGAVRLTSDGNDVGSEWARYELRTGLWFDVRD